MVLRYEVVQAEAFRQGVNVPKSTNHLDVDPAKLTQEERNLIADRLEGIDVCQLDEDGEKLFYSKDVVDKIHNWIVTKQTPARIVAKLPTFGSLMEAVRENEKQVHRASAGKKGKVRLAVPQKP